jgi:hypothetical protein
LELIETELMDNIDKAPDLWFAVQLGFGNSVFSFSPIDQILGQKF